MGLFTTNACDKFFTYKTRNLNIKGISAALGEKAKDFSFNVGEISFGTEYTEATERLMELDLLQYTVCQNINKLDKKSPMRNTLVEELVQILMEMMLIAQKHSK